MGVRRSVLEKIPLALRESSASTKNSARQGPGFMLQMYALDESRELFRKYFSEVLFGRLGIIRSRSEIYVSDMNPFFCAEVM